MPARRGADGGTQHPVADLDDQAGLLRHREEFVGRTVAAIRHAPANQRFDQRHVERLGVDQRLIEQLELVVLDGASQSLLDRELRRCGDQQLRRERRELAASERLGAEQRRIRGTQQRLRIPLVIGKHARAHADAHDDLAIVHLQRRIEGAHDARAEGEYLIGIDGALLHEREFIAAQSRGEPAILRDRLEPPRDGDQHAIPVGMSHAVVERLEVVDVEEEHADALAGDARPIECLVERAKQLPAVGDARERILLRELLQLARALLDLGFETLLRIARRGARHRELLAPSN